MKVNAANINKRLSRRNKLRSKCDNKKGYGRVSPAHVLFARITNRKWPLLFVYITKRKWAQIRPMKISEIVFMTLMSALSAGPAVSLYGSPTVSPTTAAL